MLLDRVTILALVVAAGSMAVSAIFHGSSEFTVRHGLGLLFPLAVIAWPEILDRAFRHSRHGFSHGGEGPAPSAVIRVVAWVLLVTMVTAYHAMAFSGTGGKLLRQVSQRSSHAQCA